MYFSGKIMADYEWQVRNMKYIAILLSLFWLFLLYQFVSAVVERGLPTHPAYYVSAAFGVVFGFITNCMDRMREKIVASHQLIGRIVLLVIFLLLFVSLGFQYSGNEIIRLIGGGYFFWFPFSMIGFWGYSSFRKWRLSKRQSGPLETKEDTS